MKQNFMFGIFYFFEYILNQVLWFFGEMCDFGVKMGNISEVQSILQEGIVEENELSYVKRIEKLILMGFQRLKLENNFE